MWDFHWEVLKTPLFFKVKFTLLLVERFTTCCAIGRFPYLRDFSKPEGTIKLFTRCDTSYKMWFKIGLFCSKSPKWKLFELPWLKKHVLFGLLQSSLGSPCIEGRQRSCLYTPLLNMYILFLIRMTLSHVNPSICGWLFLSLLTHFAAVGGSIWTQISSGILETARVSRVIIHLRYYLPV